MIAPAVPRGAEVVLLAFPIKPRWKRAAGGQSLTGLVVNGRPIQSGTWKSPSSAGLIFQGAVTQKSRYPDGMTSA